MAEGPEGGNAFWLNAADGTRLRGAVPAKLEVTAVVATVAVKAIPVVALFPGVDDPVAAGRQLAARRADSARAIGGAIAFIAGLSAVHDLVPAVPE